MIQFINNQSQAERLEKEFESKELDPIVRAITYTLASYCFYNFEEVFWITSIKRDIENEPNRKPSVHNFWRGLDGDNDGISKEDKKKVEDYINSIYQYDPERPDKKVCDVHTIPGRGGDHFHLQVHPNTTIRR